MIDRLVSTRRFPGTDPMAHKQILFRSAAREKILRGATQLADSIRVTLGPRSKAVLIERKWGTPIVCNDGVTICKEFDLKDPEENLGACMLRRRALDAPTRQIAENSAVDGGVVVARMLQGKGNEGFDAGRKQYVDQMEAGIIDPTKVVRIALENAVSVASILLLTEATMTKIPEDKKEQIAEPEMSL